MILMGILVFSGLTILCNLVAVFRRHNVFLIVASMNTSVLATCLALCSLSSLYQDVRILIQAYTLILLLALGNLVFCGAAVLIYRSRGSLRLEDYREIRG